MLRTLKPYFHLNLADVPALGGLLAGLFLLWELVLAGVIFIGRVDSIPVILNILMPCLAGALVLILAGGNTNLLYDLCVKLGRTRREVVAGLLTVSVTEGVLFFLLAWGLGQLEALLAHHAWGAWLPRMEVDFELVNFCPLWLLLLIGVGCALLGFTGGALIYRFGKKVGWILWGLWMAFFLIQSQTEWRVIPLEPTLWGLGVCALLAFGWSLWSLHRASVKN